MTPFPLSPSSHPLSLRVQTIIRGHSPVHGLRPVRNRLVGLRGGDLSVQLSPEKSDVWCTPDRSIRKIRKIFRPSRLLLSVKSWELSEIQCSLVDRFLAFRESPINYDEFSAKSVRQTRVFILKLQTFANIACNCFHLLSFHEIAYPRLEKSQDF